MLQSPLAPETVETHAYAYELLTALLDAFGIAPLRSALPALLDAAFQAVRSQADFALSSAVFPFLSALMRHAAQDDAVVAALERFLPFLDELVFSYSEYVDAQLPSAEEEFGSLGGAFEGRAQEEGYRIVRIDAERARCKAAALKTLVEITRKRLMGGAKIPVEELDNLASAVVSLCSHSNQEIQHSAVGTGLRGEA